MRPWLALQHWLAANTFAPTWLPRRWRHPVVGYLVAVLAQLAAISLTLHLHLALLQAFPYRGALSDLVVVLIALCWGVGPSVLSTLVGAALLTYLILPPYNTWYFGASQVVATIVLLGVSLSISVLVSGMAHARRMAQAATTRERQQREKAETAVQMRDEILNLAAHDMRTPVTNALGRAQLVQYRLRRGAPLEVAWLDAQMEAIGAALRGLNAMLDEMSDVARLQIGQALDLQLEDLDAGALVRTVASAYSGAAGTRRVNVRVPAEAVLVSGDRVRLERVLHNLLGNAVKYSPQGTPIDVDVQPQEQRALITVRDQGVGIPAEELAHIFTRYFRASTAHGVKGTGIGLAGSKAIIGQHHGHITVESVVGQGTTVTVCLPRSTGADAHLPGAEGS
jgi:signal transduction histidine kinase